MLDPMRAGSPPSTGKFSSFWVLLHKAEPGLWMTPLGAPDARQASECSGLLDPRANDRISAQHQPGRVSSLWVAFHAAKLGVHQFRPMSSGGEHRRK